MPPGARKLSAADRAELCRRVDLRDVLERDGVEVRRNGAAYVCKLRPDERTPSCHVYPPGVGRKGADGWTLKDYGDGWGGDALAYLVDKRGLPFVDAVAELCRLAGWTPPGWQNDALGSPMTAERHGGHTKAAPPPPRASTVPVMALDAQQAAVEAFMAELLALVPDAAEEGAAYLAGRGCLPATGAACWVLPAAVCGPLAARLAAGPEAELLLTAGLLKPAADGKPVRLPWWDRVALLGCHDAAGRLAYLVGRRLDWTDGDRWGKYVNQLTAAGAVRWPFGLPALYAAAGAELMLVEGPLDALGAAVLGWPAVALLTRLQSHDYADRNGAAARALEAHLPALRDVRRVRVVPDADPGDKGAEGEALAGRLVGWLRHAGVNADVARLVDLVPDAPEGCKDLADVAQARRLPAEIDRDDFEERAAILEYDAGFARLEAERRALASAAWEWC